MAECRWDLPWTRKYAIEILKRFGMMDCKTMTTPMASNLKLLSDASLEVVDATMYGQMIGSLMYLMNTKPDMLCSEHLEPIPGESETCSPDSCKACTQVPKRYSGLWPQI